MDKEHSSCSNVRIRKSQGSWRIWRSPITSRVRDVTIVGRLGADFGNLGGRADYAVKRQVSFCTRVPVLYKKSTEDSPQRGKSGNLGIGVNPKRGNYLQQNKCFSIDHTLKGHDFSRAVNAAKMNAGFSPFGKGFLFTTKRNALGGVHTRPPFGREAGSSIPSDGGAW